MSDKTLNLMLKKERQAFIMRQVNLHNRALSADLINQLNVSEDTIRRDLNELADAGHLVKVHGGALSKSYSYATQANDVYAYEQKEIIARKALNLLHDGMFVLLGGGTTVTALVRMMPDTLRLTCLTISPAIALELTEHPSVEVILIGGQLSKQTPICLGGATIHRLSEMRVDLCLMGTSGIDLAAGLTEAEWEVIQVKRAMLKAAKQIVVLTISEKFGSSERMKYCDLSDIDLLITELSPNDILLEPYQKNGVKIL